MKVTKTTMYSLSGIEDVELRTILGGLDVLIASLQQRPGNYITLERAKKLVEDIQKGE